MPSDLTFSQRVTLLTESAQSNQVARVLTVIQAYSFFPYPSFFFWMGGGRGGGGIQAKGASLCLHFQSNHV